MIVASNKVVTIDYTLKDEHGKVLDSSPAEHFSYLHGHSNIVPGLEKALEGKVVGERVQTVLTPENGYGLHRPKLVFAIHREMFGEVTPPLDTMVEVETKEGDKIRARVIGVQGDQVDLDANHPFAGVTLHYEVQIMAVRNASPEEIARGGVR